MKAESAQAIATMLEEMQKKNEQMMEQKEKCYQEHLKQLIKKIERERAQLTAEQERTLTFKLQVFSCVFHDPESKAQCRIKSYTRHSSQLCIPYSFYCCLCLVTEGYLLVV
jgi:hypothetical protein